MIVEEEQEGKERAKYGAALLKKLSIRLTGEFGAGFDERELRRMRQFYCHRRFGAHCAPNRHGDITDYSCEWKSPTRASGI